MRAFNAIVARLVFAWLLALMVAGTAHAEPARWGDPPPIELSRLAGETPLFGHAAYARSTAPLLDGSGPPTSIAWRPLTASVRNQGITKDTFYIAFRVVNDTPNERTVVVSHDIANLSTFAVEVVSPDGATARTVVHADEPFADRPLAYAGLAASIDIPAGSNRTVVVSFANDYVIPLHIDLRLWTARAFERHVIVDTAFFVFWIACLLMTAVFWTLYGTIMRRLRMLAYAVYMYGLVATYALFSGVAYLLVFPDQAWVTDLGYHWSMFLLTAAAFEFARRHLDMAANHPWHDRILRGAAFLTLALALASLLVLPPSIEAPLTFVAINGGTLYIAVVSWIAWRKDRLTYATWMVFGWTMVSASALFATFGSMVNLPFTTATQMDFVKLTFAITVLESLFLSISLAQWLRSQDTLRIAAEEAAARDSLTGLLNRRGFGQHVASLAARDKEPVHQWLAAIDINRFKHINDTHSHAAGDAVLVHLAQILVDEVRVEDTVARFGGEEFVLLFSAQTEAAAKSVLERTRDRFAQTPTIYGDDTISHTFSAGLVCASDYPEASETRLVALADEALYGAKRDGRNRVHVLTTGHPFAEAQASRS